MVDTGYEWLTNGRVMNGSNDGVFPTVTMEPAFSPRLNSLMIHRGDSATDLRMRLEGWGLLAEAGISHWYSNHWLVSKNGMLKG